MEENNSVTRLPLPIIRVYGPIPSNLKSLASGLFYDKQTQFKIRKIAIRH